MVGLCSVGIQGCQLMNPLFDASVSTKSRGLQAVGEPLADQRTIPIEEKARPLSKRAPLLAIHQSLSLPASSSADLSPQAQREEPAQFPGTTPTLTRISEAALERAQNKMLERMTLAARKTDVDSPYHQTTWLTYYGRPTIKVMGILGEFDIDGLTARLRAKAREYDEANGPGIDVMPAYHLVYGMATEAAGADGDYLAFLSEETVMQYVNRAAEEGFAVILDIQIGALSPVEAMRYGFPFLRYPGVHLGIDPEFALVHPNQRKPGDPIGFVTAEEVNQVQAAMFHYMISQGIRERRILLVHQFLDEMIRDKDDLDHSYPIELTLSVDGWGGPGGKISKYNSFVDKNDEFSSLKLFYRWDDPILTPAQALGLAAYDEYWRIDVMPNMIIYQ